MLDAERQHAANVLNDLLQNGDDAIRCYAARTAASIEAFPSIDALMTCIYNQDPDVCIDAATALGALKASQAIPRLVEVVEAHPDGDAKMAAVVALGQIATPEALNPLITWVKGAPNGEWNVDADWDDWWDIQLHAIKVLGKQRYLPALPTLIELVEEQNLDIEGDLLTAIARMGSDGVTYAITLLSNGSARMARRAALALRHADCQRSAIALFKCFSHSDEDVRAAAARAIGERQCQQYFIDLLGLLADPSAEVQRVALAAALSMRAGLKEQYQRFFSTDKLLQQLPDLSTTGRTLVFDLLTDLIDSHTLTPTQRADIRQSLFSPDADEQVAAIHLLVAIEDQESLSSFIQQMSNEAVAIRVRREMIAAIGRLGSHKLDTLIQLNEQLSGDDAVLRLATFDALAALAAKGVTVKHISANDLLVAYARGDAVTQDKMRRSRAISQIPVATETATGEGIAAPITQQDEQIQAIFAQLGDVYPAEDGLEDEAAVMSTLSAPQSTLASIEREAVAAAVISPSDPADDSARAPHIRTMMDQLGAEDEGFADIVLSHLDNGEKLQLNRKKIAKPPSFSNQILAIRALSHYPSEENLERLFDQLMDDDNRVLTEAVTSLGLYARSGKKLKGLQRATGPLCALILSGDEQLRLACARTLGALSQRASVAVLLVALSDEDSNVRLQTIRSLQQLLDATKVSGSLLLSPPDRETVIEAVNRCVDDDSHAVSIAAIEFAVKQRSAAMLMPVMRRGLTDDALQPAAANGLRQLDQASASHALLDVITDDAQASQKIAALMMLSSVLAA